MEELGPVLPSNIVGRRLPEEITPRGNDSFYWVWIPWWLHKRLPCVIDWHPQIRAYYLLRVICSTWIPAGFLPRYHNRKSTVLSSQRARVYEESYAQCGVSSPNQEHLVPSTGRRRGNISKILNMRTAPTGHYSVISWRPVNELFAGCGMCRSEHREEKFV